jgi:hypothetical protein
MGDMSQDAGQDAGRIVDEELPLECPVFLCRRDATEALMKRGVTVAMVCAVHQRMIEEDRWIGWRMRAGTGKGAAHYVIEKLCPPGVCVDCDRARGGVGVDPDG